MAQREIQPVRLHESAAQGTDGCASWGPLKICWNFSGGKVQVCVYLLGVKVACATLDPQNPCLKLDFNVGLASVKGEICLKGGCLWGKFEACLLSKCWKVEGNIVCFDNFEVVDA